MPDLFFDLLERLGDASGWVVLVAVLLLAAWGFYKGWWVPGYVYQRELERGDRAEDAVDASTRTTEAAASATHAATDAALAVANQLRALQDLARGHSLHPPPDDR